MEFLSITRYLTSIFVKLKKILCFDPNNTYEGLDILEKYLSYFHIMSSKSFEDYVLRRITIRRKLITFFFNLIVLIHGLRFTIIAYFGNTFVKIYFADFTPLIAEPSVALALIQSFPAMAVAFVGN